MIIRTDDVLGFLVARSCAPSTFGAQLDRLRFGLTATPDPFRARDDAENEILERAQLLRCMADFTERQEFRGNSATTYRALEKVQKATTPRLAQGHIALAVLRSYQEWATNSQERALVEVYRYVCSIAPSAVPLPPKSEADLTMAFRTGKAKRARASAAEVYADSILALGAFLTIWNKKNDSK